MRYLIHELFSPLFAANDGMFDQGADNGAW